MARMMYWSCLHQEKKDAPCTVCGAREQDCYVLVRKPYMDRAGHDSAWEFKPLFEILECYNSRFEDFDKEIRQTIGKKIYEDQRLINKLIEEIDELRNHAAEEWHDWWYEYAKEHEEPEKPKDL